MALKAHERIDELYSLKIKVIQNPQVFSFSLDAVLLANFTKLKWNPRSLTVDLCSGNGAVGMFISHKTLGRILEIEIQPKLVDMAKRSIALNHLQNRVKMYHADLDQGLSFIPKNSVDTVTCNPPYFKVSKASRENPNPYLNIARHEVKTTLENVVKVTSRLLNSNGKAYFVYRPGRLLDLLNLFQKYGLAPKVIQFAYSKNDTDSKLVLVKAVKGGKIDGLKVLPPIIVMKDGHYSPVMKRIMFGD